MGELFRRKCGELGEFGEGRGAGRRYATFKLGLLLYYFHLKLFQKIQKCRNTSKTTPDTTVDGPNKST